MGARYDWIAAGEADFGAAGRGPQPDVFQYLIDTGVQVEIRAVLRVVELGLDCLCEQIRLGTFRAPGDDVVHLQIPSGGGLTVGGASVRYSAASSRTAAALVPLRSSMRPSRISSRSASSSATLREPTSAWTLSISVFCTSGVSTGDPSVFHQAVIGSLNC